MPIVHQHLHYLQDLASTFTMRLQTAKTYRANLQLSIVPVVLQKTRDGADYLRKAGWAVSVSSAETMSGLKGTAKSVTYMVSKMSTSSYSTHQVYSVKLICDDKQEWYKNISCKCNRTLAYGRPCFHASLCLLYPTITDINQFVRDPQWFHYGRSCWYSDKFLVSTMIEQYSKEVVIRSFKTLTSYRVFPPIIYALPGKLTLS